MDILIMGCRYGIPNYGNSQDIFDHTEVLLQARGHTVYNCCRDGITNYESLITAQQFMQGAPISNYISSAVQYSDTQGLDLVIWFQTKLDTEYLHPFSLYEHYAKFFQKLDTKTAVIGGASDMLTEFLDFYQPDFFLQSWRRTILCKETPMDNILSPAELKQTSFLSRSDRSRLSQDNQTILGAMKKSPLFYYGTYPGPEAHRDLVQRLIDANLVT